MMHVESPAGQPIIVMRRTFRAPREIVWTAFTRPEHLAKWYGGHGFANPVCLMDVRPGGIWRHTMRTPDGTEIPMEFVYVEVVRPEKLVWKNVEHGKAPPPGRLNVLNTVTLEDAGAETRWQLVAQFDSVADRDLALEKGFTRVITQGSEKLDDVARALHASAAEGISARSLAMGTFVPLLRDLSALLDKGAAHANAKGFDPAVLVRSRLAPDMYSLDKQVELACFHAKDAAARLSGGTPPAREEPADTLDGMKARIAATLAALEAAPPGAFDGADERAIVMDLPGGEVAFEMTGYEFLRDWAIPHFYFHVVTAYDILRHNGLDIGKRDYLAGVGKYLRPRRR
jgi:hypothetical protein